MAAVALLLGDWLGTDPMGHTRVLWSAVPLGFLSAGPLLLALGVLLAWPGEEGRAFVDRATTRVAPLFARAGLGTLLIVAVSAGVGEELLFRGVVQPGFIAWLGTAPGLLLASLIFGAVHWLSPGYAVAAAIGGLYFGVVAILSGNLFIPMLGHALYDLVALLILTQTAT